MSVEFKAAVDELSKLESSTLEWLLWQSYEPADHGLKAAIHEIMWRRHGVIIAEWPSWSSEATLAHLAKRGLPANHFIHYCRDARGPDDPNHQPSRAVSIPRNSEAQYIECSCGKRFHEHELRTCQRFETPHTWPVERIDGVPHYVVCRHAPRAYDRFHGRRSLISDTCICGGQLDERWLDTPLPRIPAQ